MANLPSKKTLYQMGVELVEQDPPTLRCKLCGQEWEAHPEADKLYYRCPKGCNNLL